MASRTVEKETAIRAMCRNPLIKTWLGDARSNVKLTDRSGGISTEVEWICPGSNLLKTIAVDQLFPDAVAEILRGEKYFEFAAFQLWMAEQAGHANPIFKFIAIAQDQELAVALMPSPFALVEAAKRFRERIALIQDESWLNQLNLI